MEDQKVRTVRIVFNGHKPEKAQIVMLQIGQVEAPRLPGVIPLTGEHTYDGSAFPYAVDTAKEAAPTWVGIHVSKIGKVIPLILFSDIANATKWLLAPGANPETLAHGPGWSSADDVWNGGVSYILKLGGQA